MQTQKSQTLFETVCRRLKFLLTQKNPYSKGTPASHAWKQKPQVLPYEENFHGSTSLSPPYSPAVRREPKKRPTCPSTAIRRQVKSSGGINLHDPFRIYVMLI